jgi:hypothetical protein
MSVESQTGYFTSHTSWRGLCTSTGPLLVSLTRFLDPTMAPTFAPMRLFPMSLALPDMISLIFTLCLYYSTCKVPFIIRLNDFANQGEEKKHAT